MRTTCPRRPTARAAWSRGSGLCTRCIDGCRGNCEVFKATFRGREVIYPGPFGEITAGGDKDYPVDYSHLNIQGYALGAEGLPEGVEGNSDTALFPDVNTETEYGWDQQGQDEGPDLHRRARARPRSPARTGSTSPSARPSRGVTLVCGENVCGIDPELERDAKGKVTQSPDMDRRIETYRRYHRGLRRNPRADERRGHPPRRGRVRRREARPRHHRAEVGPGRQVHRRRDQGRLAGAGPRAAEARLHRHARPVRPGRSRRPSRTAPSSEFERHSRLGFVDEEGFYWPRCERLRELGFKRITLKTGAYGLRELAMAIKWAQQRQDRPAHHRRRPAAAPA